MMARVLPQSEWSRVSGGDLPEIMKRVLPRDMEVIVIEDGDSIVAHMLVMRLTHLEGVWIKPGYEHSANRLLRHTVQSARKWNDRWVVAGANDDTMRDIMSRMGGRKIEAEFYSLGLGG
jgi:hypothetical protein